MIYIYVNILDIVLEVLEYTVARAHTLTVDNPAKESALWMWI